LHGFDTAASAPSRLPKKHSPAHSSIISSRAIPCHGCSRKSSCSQRCKGVDASEACWSVLGDALFGLWWPTWEGV
jgi:hypothetical protein